MRTVRVRLHLEWERGTFEVVERNAIKAGGAVIKQRIAMSGECGTEVELFEQRKSKDAGTV